VCDASGLIVAIMMVLQLPPKLSRKIEVIIEFLYGMCVRPLVAFSCKATITISKKKRDPLMQIACVTETEK
jgi:hypothetical protein